MGVNAQTSVPAFTAGQVLTAAEMTEVNTGIPVFADSAARTAAFGGTGEKVLAEGQYAYLESDNSTSFWDGAAWQPVAASSGLTFITGAAFSSVTTITFPNSTFTSTYDFYKVIFAMKADSSAYDVSLQFRDNSGTKSTANYYSAFNGLIYTGSAANVTTSAGTSAAIGSVGVGGGNFDMTVVQPTDATIRTTVAATSFGNDRGRAGGLIYIPTEEHTGLVITATGNVSGFYKVYGYQNS
jgi:hypothetical protein